MSHPQEQTSQTPGLPAHNNESNEADGADFFDSILSLEDQYYAEGYELGASDGARAGRTEGRAFGLEKGFEKFLEMGRLGGKATVWSARLDDDEVSTQPATIRSERLKKHITRLAELTDPNTLSTSNNEEAVSDFDERLAGGQAKTRLILNSLRSSDHSHAQKSRNQDGADGGIAARTTDGSAPSSDKKRAPLHNPEMEDFAGLPRPSSSQAT